MQLQHPPPPPRPQHPPAVPYYSREDLKPAASSHLSHRVQVAHSVRVLVQRGQRTQHYAQLLAQRAQKAGGIRPAGVGSHGMRAIGCCTTLLHSSLVPGRYPGTLMAGKGAEHRRLCQAPASYALPPPSPALLAYQVAHCSSKIPCFHSCGWHFESAMTAGWPVSISGRSISAAWKRVERKTGGGSVMVILVLMTPFKWVLLVLVLMMPGKWST